jgi:hypothetical protein
MGEVVECAPQPTWQFKKAKLQLIELMRETLTKEDVEQLAISVASVRSAT